MLRTTQGGAAGRQVDWVNGKGVGGEGVLFLYKGNSMVGWLLFPTCQVRLVRFYVELSPLVFFWRGWG